MRLKKAETGFSPLPLRTLIPLKYSRNTVAATNPQSAKLKSATGSLRPKTRSARRTAAKTAPGKTKFLLRFAVEAFFHDISGPIPISRIRTSPMGTPTALK